MKTLRHHCREQLITSVSVKPHTKKSNQWFQKKDIKQKCENRRIWSIDPHHQILVFEGVARLADLQKYI